MSDTVDPPRLIDDPKSDLLREALSSARDDMPKASAIEAMLARFPAGPGGGGPGGPAHPPAGPSAPPSPIVGSAPLSATAKLIGALVVAGGLGVGAYVGVRHADNSRVATPSASSTSATSQSALPATSAETKNAPIDTAPSASSSGAPSATAPILAPKSSASADVDPRSEMDVLREAQAALASNPAKALALANEHQKLFPHGSLGQERDMIRIQALLAEGHADEARAMANDFRRRHPDSAHNNRLDELFPQ